MTSNITYRTLPTPFNEEEEDPFRLNARQSTALVKAAAVELKEARSTSLKDAALAAAPAVAKKLHFIKGVHAAEFIASTADAVHTHGPVKGSLHAAAEGSLARIVGGYVISALKVCEQIEHHAPHLHRHIDRTYDKITPYARPSEDLESERVIGHGAIKAATLVGQMTHATLHGTAHIAGHLLEKIGEDVLKEGVRKD